MNEHEKPARAAAAAAVCARWELRADHDSDSVSRTFLKKIAAGEFEYDARLVGEFALLSDKRNDTVESVRLVVEHERRLLLEMTALPQSQRVELFERSTQFNLGFESLLSASWYAEVNEMFAQGWGATQGIAFEVYHPPAQRRPHQTASEWINGESSRRKQGESDEDLENLVSAAKVVSAKPVHNPTYRLKVFVGATLTVMALVAGFLGYLSSEQAKARARERGLPPADYRSIPAQFFDKLRERMM